MIVDRRPSQQIGDFARGPISVDIMDFLTGDFGVGDTPVLWPTEVLQNRWRVWIGRPVSIDIVDCSMKVTLLCSSSADDG